MESTINPDNLIPPDGELAHLLLQWSEDADTSTWKIANVTNELIEELVSEGGITRQDIYRSVAARCKGRKINTIRRWAEVAADFDSDIQFEYAGLLSFEHFKASRRLFHEGYTPSIEYGLEWCVKGDDLKLTAGKFHTVGEMINQFVPEFKENSPSVSWNRVKQDLYDKFLLIDNDTDRNRLLKAWKEIEYVLCEKHLDKKPEAW